MKLNVDFRQGRINDLGTIISEALKTPSRDLSELKAAAALDPSLLARAADSAISYAVSLEQASLHICGA